MQKYKDCRAGKKPGITHIAYCGLRTHFVPLARSEKFENRWPAKGHEYGCCGMHAQCVVKHINAQAHYESKEQKY